MSQEQAAQIFDKIETIDFPWVLGTFLFYFLGAYLFYGALGSRFNLLETCVKASPLLLTGLAVAFAFRAKFWNIGAEGQLLAGALTATALSEPRILLTTSPARASLRL